jgi:hypothetical protein
VRGAGLERGVGVCDGHTGIVVQVDLNVTTDDTPERPHKFVNLTRVGAPDSVGDSHPVDTNLVHGLVNREQVDQVRTERIFRRESNLDSLGLDEVDDFDGRFGDIIHILSMREFTKEGRRSDDDVNTINTYTTQNSGIISRGLTCFTLTNSRKGIKPIPVSTAIRASSIWHLMCVRILAFNPSLQIASQSLRDCSDAAGEVSSRYSTPKASNALAMAILVLVSKKALANCSPSV